MNILVTGAKGFVGKNLVENLKNLRDRKDRTRPGLIITDIFEYDMDTDRVKLESFCEKADFVFNLAGVNRPQDTTEFIKGNFGFASTLLNTLKMCHNTCPVMLASSSQASLAGRFSNSEYGKSKLAGEKLFFEYGSDTGAKVLVYRFPNLFGKWCRPNYNSAIATFCNAVANDEPYTVNDRSTELELLYIDDLICEMLDALEGKEHHCEYKGLDFISDNDGCYCYVPVIYHATLGEIIDLLQMFRTMPETLTIPDIPENSFEKKLYSTYLSYLPESKISFDLDSKIDKRGSFTELLHTFHSGQISVNITKPGITKGQHWHNSKWEIFIVVSGRGLIQMRRIGTDPETGNNYPIHSFKVSGDKIRAVQILPGYTHNITNLSDTEDLITVMWANEQFDEGFPDTFYEPIEG